MDDTGPQGTLNTAEAAARLGLAVSTVEKLRLTGDGPKYLKLGRAVRYRVDTIDAWLSAREVSSTSQRVAA